MLARPDEHRVDLFFVARIERFEHRHEAPRVEVRVDVKAREPREPEPGDGCFADALVVAEQQVAGRRQQTLAFLRDERPSLRVAAQADAVVAVEVVGRCRHAVALEIRRRADDDHPAAAEFAHHEPRIVERARADRDVAALVERIDERIRQHDVERDVRIAALELRQERHQMMLAERHVRIDPHAPLRSRAVRRFALGVGDVLENAHAALVKRGAFGRELQLARRAIQQAHAEPRLEPLNELADRRRRHVEPSSRRRESARLDHLNEDGHLGETIDLAHGRFDEIWNGVNPSISATCFRTRGIFRFPHSAILIAASPIVYRTSRQPYWRFVARRTSRTSAPGRACASWLRREAAAASGFAHRVDERGAGGRRPMRECVEARGGQRGQRVVGAAFAQAVAQLAARDDGEREPRERRRYAARHAAAFERDPKRPQRAVQRGERRLAIHARLRKERERQRVVCVEHGVGRERPHERFFPQQLAGFVVEAAAVLAEHDVEPARGLLPQQFRGDANLQFDRRARMQPAERVQHLRQPRAGEILRRADAQPAMQRRAAQPRTRLALHLDDVARVRIERLARLREFDAPRRAGEQHRARRLLEPLDVPADGRRREREPFGGGREAAAVGDFEKGAQQHDVERHRRRIRRGVHAGPQFDEIFE
ncbi:hypothetical protein BURPS1710b_1156 [Burkholderia pseudomallei 1710b]|uniref:Uncharacterized protein n=1 Tax=Burkholderia pseudomallei (strain 1710b) TaxID=320372 RepID=Q3JV35_BURP1|nr:hypothetical protein BURPS1710b_1156 [Burkholderia pseudomallei 1710b]